MVEKTFKPEGYDIHPNGTLKLSALMRYMQAAATADTEKYGSDYATLRKDDMIFVVYQTAIEINCSTSHPSTVTVKTWQRSIEGVRFVRDYAISIGDGTAVATNTWTLVNFVTRRILRPSSLKNTIPSFPDMKERAETNKLPSVQKEEMEYAGQYKVMYSTLDENGHVNNTIYSDIAIDFMPFDVSAMQTKHFNIIYAAEAKLGDTLDIYTKKDGDSYYLAAFLAETDKKIFETEISLLQI